MKLTLNVAEVQEAVTQHIIASGFPVDMDNAVISISEDGADISFEKVETETAPKAKRKGVPKAKKPKETEATSDVENTDEDEEEEAVEEIAVKDESETVTVEETEDLILAELDEQDEPVVNNEETGNDFSLFG